MSEPVIASVVEGHGEVDAVPVLVRRIAFEVFHRYDVTIPKPHRAKRSRLWKTDEWPRAIEMQSLRVTSGGGVLVIVDADDDCAIKIAENLRSRAGGLPVEVVVAVREFESWFLAAVESLRTHRLVRDDASYDRDPEARAGAKEALQKLMLEPYRETIHQAAFAQTIDLEGALRTRSFRHLVSAVGRLLGVGSSTPT